MVVLFTTYIFFFIKICFNFFIYLIKKPFHHFLEMKSIFTNQKMITLTDFRSKSKLENSLNYSPQERVATASVQRSRVQKSTSPGYLQPTDTFRSVRAHQNSYGGPPSRQFYPVSNEIQTKFVSMLSRTIVIHAVVFFCCVLYYNSRDFLQNQKLVKILYLI